MKDIGQHEEMMDNYGKMAEELKIAKDYAKTLATYLWSMHYKDDAPDWEPFDDLFGILSQIDNMLTGLKRT